MNIQLSKQEIKEKINNLFSNNPSPNEIKNIKKLATTKNIKLGDLRKKFCKKCYNLFNSINSKIKIKKKIKIIKCNSCGQISRYKLK